MEWEGELIPYVVDTNVLLLRGCRNYRNRGCHLGECIWWDQRQILDSLGVEKKVAYRKPQVLRESLQRCSEDFDLGGGQHRTGGARLGNPIVLRSALGVHWLLGVWLPPRGPRQLAARCRQALALCFGLAMVSTTGLRHLPQQLPLQMLDECGEVIACIPHPGTHDLVRGLNVASLVPYRVCEWASVRETYPELADMLGEPYLGHRDSNGPSSPTSYRGFD